ncbi:MAG: plasmid pRiA4b ORF-3 family protein [Candidatus Aquicultor sp.]
MSKKKFDTAYEFKITLKGIKPPIWRKIQVPSTYNFWDLHVAIQDAMGWLDYHLHEFKIKNPSTGREEKIGMLNDEIDYDDDIVPEEGQVIADWFSMSNQAADYLYDFGDGWEHEIKLEKILPREKGVKYPICIDGKRACPPEDCGGTWGYENLLKIIRNPKHGEYQETMEWLGGRFDPERFDCSAVSFDNPDKRWDIAFGYESQPPLPEVDKTRGLQKNKGAAKVTKKTQEMPVEVSTAATANSLRLDVIAILNYIGDKELKLTQGGNLTLKDTRAVNDLFVEPQKLDSKIGDHVYKLRTEEYARRVWFLRILSQKAGLTKIRHNKISQAKAAKNFLKKDPYQQLGLLFNA